MSMINVDDNNDDNNDDGDDDNVNDDVMSWLRLATAHNSFLLRKDDDDDVCQ